MEPHTSGVSRRTLLSAGAGAPLTAVLLAACGEGGSDGTAGVGGYGPAPSPSSPSATPTSESPGPAESEEPQEPDEPAGGSLAALADIPVGGALVVQDGPDGKPVVLARPRKDEVVGFSAVCTHQGCTVRAEQGTIRCPCHGSTYDLTGANTGGPAPSPLPRFDVTVADGQVRQA